MPECFWKEQQDHRQNKNVSDEHVFFLLILDIHTIGSDTNCDNFLIQPVMHFQQIKTES